VCNNPYYHRTEVPGPATLAIRLDAAGGDDEEVAAATARLRRELLQLDVDAVDHGTAGVAPDGAKAADVLVVGTLLVNLARRAAILGSVVAAVQRWLGPAPTRTVKLELDGDQLELTGVSSNDQQRLVDLWIERHSEST
jgi:hypothetical protein